MALKEEEYRENLAHFLINEVKLGLGLQEQYEPYRAREHYLEKYFPMLDPRAKKAVLEELKEEANRKGISSMCRVLSDSPEVLAGAFSNLRRMQTKPTRKALLSRSSPRAPREIMNDEFILEREEDEEELVEDLPDELLESPEASL